MYRVLVVDDDSPDGTGAVADSLAREHPGRVDVLHRRGRRGIGRSYVDAFRRVLASDADIVCQMDADLSHAPSYLPALVSAAESFDVVIGSRYWLPESVDAILLLRSFYKSGRWNCLQRMAMTPVGVSA